MPKLSKYDWASVPLGQEPDSHIAEKLGCSRRYITEVRSRLGIAPFVGFILTQEGKPTRSMLEAKYDAYLHWKGIPHTHEPRVPDLPYVADFEIPGEGFVEIAGMAGYDRYNEKLAKKQSAYVRAGVQVNWLTAAQVETLYKGCPVEVKFRARYCSSCGENTTTPANGMCRPCNRKQWGAENGAETRTCQQCKSEFTEPAGQAISQRFCSHDCYSKSLELGWPSWEEIDERLKTVSMAELARELGVKSATLYMKLRRRRMRDQSAPPIRDSRYKLSDVQVDEMRRLFADGVRQAELGRRFALSPTTVSLIVRGKAR